MSQTEFLSDEEAYSEGLQVFDSISNCLDIGVQWIEDELPDIVKRSRNDDLAESYRVLAVGTGNGKPQEETLLDILATLDTNVIYTVIEPSGKAIKEFKILAESKYKNVTFQWFQTTYEEFTDDQCTGNGQKYNLIHFFYSWHFIATTMESLKKRVTFCYSNLLTDGGCMVSFLGNGTERTIFISRQANSPFFQLYHIPNTVGKIADEEGWENLLFNFGWEADLSTCFDESSRKGNILLDFLMHEKNFRRNFDKEQVKNVLKILESQCDKKEDGSMIAYPNMLDFNVIWKKNSC